LFLFIFHLCTPFVLVFLTYFTPLFFVQFLGYIIVSEPAGAKATVDGRLIGQTPLERVELPAGEHRLNLVKDRFAPVDAQFKVDDNAETKLSHTLEQTSFMVDIDSQPTAARLYIDGTLRGATPLKGLDLPVGEHKIRLIKNRYSPYEGKLTVKAEKEPIHFSFDLAPLFGTLKVVTTPSGASVYLQDRLIGRSPLELPDAPVGRHDLRVERDKYKPVSAQVAVMGDDTTSIHLVLEPKPGYLEVRSVPDGAKVSVGDRYIGDTPVERIELRPGEYALRLAKSKFREVTVPARIESDETTLVSLNLSPLSGYLSVISSPERAEVKLDGGVLGLTPLTRIELKAGSYKLSLAKTDYRSTEATVSVESSETTTIDLTLQYLFGSLKVSSEPAGWAQCTRPGTKSLPAGSRSRRSSLTPPNPRISRDSDARRRWRPRRSTPISPRYMSSATRGDLISSP